jgi:UDP-GlcNAc:undecaprenyl-phosphate GlcNAc-1-phosphate transferase
MAGLALVNHLLFAVVLFAVSTTLTWAMIRAALLAEPNHRSSHSAPVPNSGGVAIVITFIIGFGTFVLISDDARLSEPYMAGFAVACAGIALVSFADDLGKLRTFRIKLLAQVLAAALLLSFDISFRSITLPYLGVIELGSLGYAVTLLWLVGMTNIFNFMDGLNGLAGGSSVIAAAFFGVATFVEGSFFVYIFCYVLAAASLGFLIFNFPKGRIFMGDVGSQFLGFAFAALAVIAAEADTSRTSMLVMPLLFFSFIFDTVFTFVRRLRAGEVVTQAHRGHLYQLVNQLGYSHVQVSLFHFAVAVCQGAAAIILLQLGPQSRVFVFVPFIVFEALYAWIVIDAAKKRGLLVHSKGNASAPV